MKNRYLLLIVGCLLMGSVNEALACGSCMYINFDRILPPIAGWVILSVLWYFSLTVYAAITNTKIWGVYRPLWWLIITSILYVTSLMFIGPIFLLLLILPGIILSFKVFLLNKSIHRKEKRNLRILSVTGIACLTFMITVTVNIHRERTDADFILKYENSGPGRMVCKRLVHQTPAQLKDLREVVLKGNNSQIVAIACEGIATHGDPVRDVPLLIDAYARIYDNDENEKVELALSKLTGLSLPEGSSPDAWKERLAAESQ